jgi:hypothetical protein
MARTPNSDAGASSHLQAGALWPGLRQWVGQIVHVHEHTVQRDPLPAFRLSDFTKVAVSLGAISPRLDAQRRKEMGALLKEECDQWVAAKETV